MFRNRCDRFFPETVVPKIGITEFGGSKNGVTKSVFPFSFPKTVIPQIRVPEIGDPKSVFPFLGTILLHTLGFINRCPLVGLMSEKWTCNFSRQSFHQTKTLRRFSSSNASSPRLSSRNSREAMQKRRASRLEADSPFSENGRLIYPQNRYCRGCACAALAHCFAHAHFHLVSGRRRDHIAEAHRFKWDCACALLRACAVSFQLWEPKRTHRSGLPQEPITVPYIADIIIAWIYLALLLYKKVSSDDVISC